METENPTLVEQSVPGIAAELRGDDDEDFVRSVLLFKSI